MALDIKSTLGRKIGPLPAIAWVGMVAAVYVVYRYRKASMSQAALGDEAVVTTGGDIGSASDMTSGWGGSGGTAVGSSTNNPGFIPQDNNDWAKDAINAAIAYGWDPIQANNAVSGYVYGSGIALNEQQTSILRWVLGKIGAPPDPIASPPPTTPAPTPGPPSTPTPTPPHPLAPATLNEPSIYSGWTFGSMGGANNPLRGWGQWSTLSDAQKRQAYAHLGWQIPAGL